MDNKGFTLLEIVVTIGIGAIISGLITVSFLTFRNNVQYDILLNKVVESVNYSKSKAMSGQWDQMDTRSSFSVNFFEDRIVEFEGGTYVEGAAGNVESQVPVGFRLYTVCTPINNGIVSFTAIIGENTNDCTVYIYKYEESDPSGSVVIRKYGVEQAY